MSLSCFVMGTKAEALFGADHVIHKVNGIIQKAMISSFDRVHTL